jgi:hypothetical protein
MLKNILNQKSSKNLIKLVNDRLKLRIYWLLQKLILLSRIKYSKLSST